MASSIGLIADYALSLRHSDLRDRGMDNVFYTEVGGAVGAARVLGLDRARIAEAVALAATPNIAVDATRYGRLSMWKGCAERPPGQLIQATATGLACLFSLQPSLRKGRSKKKIAPCPAVDS